MKLKLTCLGKLFPRVLSVKDTMENNSPRTLKSWSVYLVYSLECFGDKITWTRFLNFAELSVILDELPMHCAVSLFFAGIYINITPYNSHEGSQLNPICGGWSL